MLSANTILQSRYRVLRQLGHGGMGTVYETLDERINCLVALKETSAKRNDHDARRAFEREAALLGNLHHSSLPKVMDYFSEGDGDFLVMEFIPGHDLAELLDLRGNPFPQVQVMHWADELLKVLEYLHSQNPPIFHRDIKPSNLKLTKQGEMFLLDFGLAKGAAGQMLTQTTSRSVRGYTAVYASLEQVHGSGTDPRSDLYSLAATLYHLLTGIAPIEAPQRYREIEDERLDPLQPIEKLNPHVSASVAEVIRRAMAINRRQRPDSAAEMRQALRNAVEEDEAHAVGERRTEEGDRHHEYDRRRGAEEAVHDGEDEHQRRKAETRELAAKPKTKQKHETEVARNRTPIFVAAGAISVATLIFIGWLILGARNLNRLSGGGSQQTDSKQQVGQADKLTPPNSSELPCSAQSPTRGTGRERAINLKGGVVLEMVEIPPGSFCRGSAAGTGLSNEHPQSRVTVGIFYMGKYEVTQAQWQAVMGNIPSGFKGDNLPVEKVSWDDAVAFVARLNAQNDGYSYRLPTEAEWEYACRAGTTGDYAGDLDAMAWYGNNSGRARVNAAEILRADSKNYVRRIEENGGQTHTVGTKLPNAFGLFDMNGNVWEWCQDWYHDSYNGAPTNSDAWLSGGDQKSRVLRGGSWNSITSYLRATYRESRNLDFRSYGLGFRVVAVARPQ